MCEEHDEARIKVLQNEMWICCNLLSQSAVGVDEVCCDAVLLSTKRKTCASSLSSENRYGTMTEIMESPGWSGCIKNAHFDSHHSLKSGTASNHSFSNAVPRKILHLNRSRNCDDVKR